MRTLKINAITWEGELAHDVGFGFYGSRGRRKDSVHKSVAQIDLTEWTPDGHLRHSRFVGLREHKDAREVVREG